MGAQIGFNFCHQVPPPPPPRLTDTASPLQSIYSNRNPVECDPSSLMEQTSRPSTGFRFDTTCLWRMRISSPALSLRGVALVQKRGAAFISSINVFNRSREKPSSNHGVNQRQEPRSFGLWLESVGPPCTETTHQEQR